MEKSLSMKSGGYSYNYIEEAFWLWYSNDRPAVSNLLLYLEKDSRGHKPDTSTVRNWIKSHDWISRAEEYDQKARKQVEKEYINQKTQMLVRHAKTGRILQSKGMDFLENNEIKSAHAALRAVELGIEMEREATNLERLIDTVTKMDDPKVQSKLENLLGKASLRESDDDSSV